MGFFKIISTKSEFKPFQENAVLLIFGWRIQYLPVYIFYCGDNIVLQEFRRNRMINFACKEFKVEDVIKCALNLIKQTSRL